MAATDIDWSGFPEIGAALYLKGDVAIVHFLLKNEAGEIERIPAHKVLLAARSDVFHRMFYGELKEKSDVTIVDASASAFKEFLQCFYMNKVQLTICSVRL